MREATAHEAAGVWPAVRSERLFETAEQFAAYREAGPWRVRVTSRGEASLLGLWRAHQRVLALRGVWCASRHVGAFVADARSCAREQGLSAVLSPLLPVDLLGPYRREGMQLLERITAIQGHPRGVLRADLPLGVRVRTGGEGDLKRIAELDARCFDEFWAYGAEDLRELLGMERLLLAETDDGQLIGYTLATVSRGSASLGRLGVAPEARRHGLGRALVSEVARWAEECGADTMSLCTQESNTPARRLYRETGLVEVADVYGLALGEVDQEGRS